MADPSSTPSTAGSKERQGVLDPYDGSSTGQRTHRYLRLALVLIVVALGVGVGVQIVRGDWLPSISHFYYTPAQQIFVAALVAASLAMIGLSGRGLESFLLNVAAIFAPLIALVPMGISVADRDDIAPNDEALAQYWAVDPTNDKILLGACSPNGGCVPEVMRGAVEAGVWTYVIVVWLVAIAAIWLGRGWLWQKKYRALRESETPKARLTQIVAVIVPPAIAVGVTAWLIWLMGASTAGSPFPFNAIPLDSVHYTVTILFFGAFASVSIVNAVRFFRIRHNPGLKEMNEADIKPIHAAVYVAVPILMIADFISLFTWLKGLDIGVFIGEATALVLFGFFWIAQTHQRWNEKNPLSVFAAE